MVLWGSLGKGGRNVEREEIREIVCVCVCVRERYSDIEKEECIGAFMRV